MAKRTNRTQGIVWSLVVLVALIVLANCYSAFSGPPVQEGLLKLHPPKEWGVGRVVVMRPETPRGEKLPAVVAERYKLGIFSVRVK